MFKHPGIFSLGIKTNNGVESLNKLLKYRFFPRATDKNLSTIVKVILEQYCKVAYKEYLMSNVDFTGSFKTTNESIPAYLRGTLNFSFRFVEVVHPWFIFLGIGSLENSPIFEKMAKIDPKKFFFDFSKKMSHYFWLETGQI